MKLEEFLNKGKECDGSGKKKRKRKGKVDEIYQAGKGGKTLSQLFNTVDGFVKDINQMVEYDNIDGALKTFKVLKTKVLSDIEKELKKMK